MLFFLLLGGPFVGYAQSPSEEAPFCEERGRRTASLDTRGLGIVYCTTQSVVTRPLQGAHSSARPLFYGAVPLAWGGVALFREGSDFSDVYRLALSQGTTYGLVFGLKRVVGRPRPYVHRALTSRSARHSASSEVDAYTSFPSGHAAVSAALATSWSLSHPKWYVLGPGAVWTVGVSLSRLHLGVHYPSDVLVGIGIGVGVAVLAHQFRGALTPTGVGDDSGETGPAPITVRFRF